MKLLTGYTNIQHKYVVCITYLVYYNCTNIADA